MRKFWATVNKDFIINRLVKNCPNKRLVDFPDAGKHYSLYIAVKLAHLVIWVLPM